MFTQPFPDLRPASNEERVAPVEVELLEFRTNALLEIIDVLRPE